MIIYLLESSITLFLIYMSICTLIHCKYSKKKYILIATSFILFTILFETILIMYCDVTLITVYDYSLITTAIPNLIFTILISSKKGLHPIVSFFIISLAGSIISVFSSLLAYSIHLDFYLSKLILHILFNMLLLLLCKLYLSKYLLILENYNVRNEKYLLIFPLIFEAMAISYGSNPARNYDIENKINLPYVSNIYPEEITFFLLFIILAFTMYFFTILIISETYSSIYLKEDKSNLAYQIHNLKRQQKDFDTYLESTRILNHDTKHYINLIRNLLDQNEKEEALKLISRYSETLEKNTITIYCENTLINSVINMYNNKCISNNIEFSCIYEPNVNISSLETTLAIILSNALDNAFTSCVKINNPESKFINLKIFQHNRQIIIILNNSCFDKIEFTNEGVPISNKKYSDTHYHGFGSKSIIRYCNKINAHVDFSVNENVFTTQIMIKSTL